MRQGEIVISLVLIGLGVMVWVSSAAFRPETSMASMNLTLGAGFYPRLLATCLIFCAVLLLLRALSGSSSQTVVQWHRWYAVPMASGVMLFQVWTFEILGWIPSAWITLFLLMLMTRVKLWKTIVIPTGFILFVYLFFILLLRLQFPGALLPVLFR